MCCAVHGFHIEKGQLVNLMSSETFPVCFKKKTNFHIRGNVSKCVASSGTHLRGLVSGQHTSKVVCFKYVCFKKLRSDCDTSSDLTVVEIEP